MFLVRIAIFIGLMFAVTVGMGHLMDHYMILNTTFFAGIHTATLLWGAGILFSGWVAMSVK